MSICRAYQRPITFESFFEDHLGQSHLEALQLLSSTAESRATEGISQLGEGERAAVSEQMASIKATLSLDEEEEDDEELGEVTAPCPRTP